MPHICYYFEANKLRVHEIDVLYIALPSIQFIVNVYGLLVTNILQESQRGLNLCYNNKLLEKVSCTYRVVNTVMVIGENGDSFGQS